MSACAARGRDLKEMDEDDLWEMINDNRHRISLGAKPGMLIPYLRQARVLNELDEDEILNCAKFPNWTMKTSHMLDVLHMQGKNGAMALLEGLMIHYPKLYTQVTGHKPSIESAGFSGLIKTSELTEYLVHAVTGMQRELAEACQESAVLSNHCKELQAKLSQAVGQAEEQQRLQVEHGRLRSHMAALHRDMLKLKDEKCDLYMRYTTAIEENSAVNIRCRDLQLQLYQVQFELRKAQTETDFQRQQSLKYSNTAEVQQLREEVSTLRRQLLEAEKFTPAREDILVKDLEEARDGRKELVAQMHCLQEETERLTGERDQLLKEKECLALQVQKLSLDCEMYQQKCTVIQGQLEELQVERDQAYLARDEAQGQIARSLAEKDTLRGQLVELQEKLFALRLQGNQGVAQNEQKERKLSWNLSPASSCEDPLPSPPPRPKLRRMEAICPEYMKPMDSTGSLSSFRSECVEPPGAESLRRRELEGNSSPLEMTRWDSQPSLSDLENDYIFISDGDEEVTTTSPSPSLLCSNMGASNGEAAPPFLIRSRLKALRLCVTPRVLTISFQGEALLSQLEVIGGNKTGVFIHAVKEGSPAQNVGLSPGAQIMEVQYEQDRQSLRMVLEDSTMEEALWALGQVRGFCHVSLRPNQDAYEKLLLQLKNGEVTSGDSFYVRVNLSLLGGAAGALAVKCNDILHVTDTRHGAKGLWKASHVHPCNLKDLKSGMVPNYHRAQRLLIRAIEDMTFQPSPQRRLDRCRSQDDQKAVRIVSTGRLGHNPLWVSVEEDGARECKEAGCGMPGGCLTLMPYTLVTPHHPPASRPVLLLPTVHGLIINKRLGELPEFQLCQPEVLSAGDCAVRMQKAEILEDYDQGACSCYTVQSVEKVIKQGLHCILPLGLDCVRRLHRAEIFPIVIFIASSERSVRKLRHKLHRQGLTEEQLLECSRSEKPLLDKLPCLYRTVPPDSWNDTTSTLLATLRTIILEEQRKTVWVEPDLW
ncbi:caspase recruitment domain-containing protein 14 isoform X1 [Arapaima gigas]